MKRKMFAVRADLADQVSEIAIRRGTLYDYMNDVLEQAIRAESLGLTLKEALDGIWMIKAARDAGFTPVPERVLYELIEITYGKFGEQRTMDLWYEAGQWYGRYYETLDKVETFVGRLFWDVTDFSLTREDERVSVICLSSKFSEAYTVLFSKFLEGILNALGYRLDKTDITKGIIRLNFAKSKDQ